MKGAGFAHDGSEARTGLLFTLPALTGLVLFVVVPFLLAIAISLTNLRAGSPLPLEFVGVYHYLEILRDGTFLRAVLNNVLFALVVVPLQTALALAMALFVNQRMRGSVVFRTLFFLPVVFPLSLVSVVWILIYAPGPEGALNAFLDFVSFGAWEPRDFLRDRWLALPAIMLTSIWQGTGFQMVILLAGLQSIPQQLYEAATLDGANAWQRFRLVTLPLLRRSLTVVIVITSILSFRVFDQVRVMTQGGPDGASTTVIYAAVQSAFDRAQVARGSAMTIVFFLLVLGITLAQRRLLRERGPS